jgi:hypothetical protein
MSTEAPQPAVHRVATIAQFLFLIATHTNTLSQSPIDVGRAIFFQTPADEACGHRAYMGLRGRLLYIGREMHVRVIYLRFSFRAVK